jgi:hypothetical protein
MKFTVFSKRRIAAAPANSITPTLNHSTLFQEGNNIEVCVLRGEDEEVDSEFQQLKMRTDLLIVELFSGNIELPDSSVNTWLHKRLAQLLANTPAVPSH